MYVHVAGLAAPIRPFLPDPIQQFSAEEIRALREREDVSQSVFASYLNITKDSVSKWERGEKKPTGPSLKLLSLAERKGLEAIA